MLLSQYEFLYSSLVIKLQSLRCPWCNCVEQRQLNDVCVDNCRVSFVQRLATSDSLLVVLFSFFLLASVLTCLSYHFKYYRYCFYCSSLDRCVCMSVLCVRVCAFVPVIFLLDSCVFYVRMFYGPSWSDLNKYNFIFFSY